MHDAASPIGRWAAPGLLSLLVLAGCASGPATSPVFSGRDGPDASPPSGLTQVPDAEPRIEPLRTTGGTTKPYEVGSRTYVPLVGDQPFNERGLASWYGKKFHGRPTASGEPYDMYAMSAAHPTLPIPSYVRVRNPANGREVIVRVNDRGPFHPGRIIDLSYTAALKLDLLRGVAPVEIWRITFDEIRSGSWRRTPAPGESPVQVAQPAPAPVTPVPSTLVVPTVAVPDPAPPPVIAASSPAAAGFWVQLGAFRERDGALAFQQRVVADLGVDAPQLAVFNERAMHRLQAGPYTSRDDAQRAAALLREQLQLVPMVVERR